MSSQMPSIDENAIEVSRPVVTFRTLALHSGMTVGVFVFR